MNKPINIQTFVCEISKCPDIQQLKSENEELKKAKEEYYLNNLSYEIKLSELTHALEEIRDIAIYECRHDCSEIYELCTIESCLEKRIQRLVNEVLEDENI